jgi:photosystem II stability/assembly factor-like uncharacterized protein
MRNAVLALAVFAWIGTTASSIAGAPTDEVALSNGVSLDGLTWRNIGPFRGGRTTAIAGVPSQSFTFYMGTAGGGIYKTTDAGVRWTNVSDGFVQSASVGAIAVAPSNPNIVYAGMGEDTARANTLHSGDGIYKSVDAGKTWIHLGLDATEVISRIVIDPKDPDAVYVAAQGALYAPTPDRGIYRTNDGGKTWKHVLFVGNTVGATDLSMNPRDRDTLYASLWDYQRFPWALRQFGPETGLYKSTDRGGSWSKIDNGLPAKLGKIAVAASADPDRIYAIVQADPNSQSGLYASGDGGLSWKLVNADPRLTIRAFYYTKLFPDPKNPDKLWVPDLSLYKSTDGGKTFTGVSETPHGDHHELWINPENTDIVAEASDGGGSVSLDDGATWSAVDNQPTGQFYRLSVDDGFPYRVYAAQQDDLTVGILSRSEEGGIGERDWYPVGGTESSFIDVDPKHPSTVFTSDTLGVFDVFEQDTHTEQTQPIDGEFAWGTLYDEFTKYRYSLNAPVFVSRHDPAKIYYGANKLLLSIDRGKSWREISPDLTHVGVDPDRDQHVHMGLVGDGNYGVLTTAAESLIAAGELWTGSSDGVVGVSRDGGKTWSRMLLPAPAADARVNTIDPSPLDPATAYAAATRFQFDDHAPYLFKTADYGKTWTRIDAGLPAGHYARVIRADTVRKGLLYAGTEAGVDVSFDEGRSWKPLQGGLPLTPITDLNVHGADLIASTSGRAIWILDDVSPLRQMPVDPGNDWLFQPSPAYRTAFGASGERSENAVQGRNPPRGAVLNVYLRDKTPATLEILNASGSVVRSLDVDHATPGGLTRVVWDLRYKSGAFMPPQIHIDGLVPPPGGRLVDPGTYAIRLTAGGRVLTAPLKVLADPRWKDLPQAYAEQDKLAASIAADLADIRQTAIRTFSARTQIAKLVEDTHDPDVIASGKALIVKLSTDRAALLYAHFCYLSNWVNAPEPDVTPSERNMFVELHSKTLAWKASAEALLHADLAAFNTALSKANLGPVVPANELSSAKAEQAPPPRQENDDDD